VRNKPDVSDITRSNPWESFIQDDVSHFSKKLEINATMLFYHHRMKFAEQDISAEGWLRV
jgi:hypothetical protein